MFDLSIPLMTDQNSGASVICMGNYSEVATIHKEDCVRRSLRKAGLWSVIER